MAVATLAACYNNPRVFTGVVKIRKGQAVALMMQSTNMKQLRTIMAQFAKEVGILYASSCYIERYNWEMQCVADYFQSFGNLRVPSNN